MMRRYGSGSKRNEIGSVNYYEIVTGPGGAAIITWAYKRNDEYLALVDLARRIESAFE